jgi:hypothetical protein
MVEKIRDSLHFQEDHIFGVTAKQHLADPTCVCEDLV